MQKKTTKPQTGPPVDREAIRVLAIELGAREAARRTGVNENTILSWSRRYKWDLPKRTGGPKAIELQLKPGDVLIASHKELEDGTKTALMQTVAKAAQLAAQKPAMDVSTTAQLRDLALTMAKLCGWHGKPSVTTYYGDDNRTVVICDAERRQQLIEQRQRLLEQEAEPTPGHKVAAVVPAALPAPAPHPEINVATGNGVAAQDQNPAPKQDPLSQWMDSVGKAETWKHAGQFGPYPEEYEKW
jgi:hypothetical protein